MNVQRAIWELKESKAPTSTPSSLEKIEAVLRDHGFSNSWCPASRVDGSPRA
jgi:hypothetical protein